MKIQDKSKNDKEAKELSKINTRFDFLIELYCEENNIKKFKVIEEIGLERSNYYTALNNRSFTTKQIFKFLHLSKYNANFLFGLEKNIQRTAGKGKTKLSDELLILAKELKKTGQ